MAVSLTTAQVIYAAQTKLLELADEVEQSLSFKRVKNQLKLGEALIRYIRVLQTDTTLTDEEELAICQHMITLGNLYDFPASPTITSNQQYNYAAGAIAGPRGEQGIPGRDGGGTDYNQYSLSSTGTVDYFDITDADAAEWSYKVKSGSDLRAGRVGAVWLADGSTIKTYEYSTMDIGDTSGIIFSVVYDSGLGEIQLQANITSGTWDINGTRYFIPNNGAGVTVASTALATGKFLIGNSINEAEAQTISGDVTINSSGVAAIGTGVIVNADISGVASIAVSKLAAMAASRAVVTDSSGLLTTSDVTATEISYLDGVTSNIQAQLDTKLGSATGAISTVVSSDLTANRVVVSSSGGKITVSGVTTTELNTLDGITASTAELNILDGVTATAAEINKLDGLTATTAELNYVSGATSNLQAQINALSSGSTNSTIQSFAWNMDTTSGINVTVSSITLANVRSVSAVLFNNAGTNIYPIHGYLHNTTSGISPQIGIGGLSQSGSDIIVTLRRVDSGTFDSTSFNAATGYIKVEYI